LGLGQDTSNEFDFGVGTLTTFWCPLVEGSPDPTEQAGIAWLAPAELDCPSWAPADIPAEALVRAQFTT
jgi:8-oxo-dGTP diphosphatase